MERDEFSEKQNRESREYYYSTDEEIERRGMPRAAIERGQYMYAHPMPRANALIIREHLQEALRAGLNSEALRHVVAAIKEIERD